MQDPGIDVALADLAELIGAEPRENAPALLLVSIALAVIDEKAGARVQAETDTLREAFDDWYGPQRRGMASGPARALLVLDLATLRRVLSANGK